MACAKAAGFDVVVTRENAGEWNQCTVYRINGEAVATVMKGERYDWNAACRVVREMSA